MYQRQTGNKLNPREAVNLAAGGLANEGAPDAVVNIILIEDKTMIDLNSAYLEHHYTTDVLTFPLAEQGEPIEGEVYVNVAQAKRQAKEYGVSPRNEIGRLIVHGVLHLVGYEDDTKKKKLRMSKREDFYLGKFGLEYFHA